MRRTLDGYEFEPFVPDTCQKVIDAARDLGLDACQADDALRPHVATGITKAAEDACELGEPVQRGGGDVAGTLDEWEPGQLKLPRRALAYTRDAGRRSLLGERGRSASHCPLGSTRSGTARWWRRIGE
jgi:hypothetical protein